MKKSFHISTVLTITDGKMVSLDHIDGVYQILEHITGEENLFTHQLPRVARECEPFLKEQFPGLAAVTVPDGLDSFEKIGAYLETLYPEHGEFVDVEQMNPTDHTHIHPLAEAKMVMPNAIIVEL